MTALLILFKLFLQRVEGIFFLDRLQDLAFFEEDEAPFASGDPVIGMSGFARSIDDAAHDRDRLVDVVFFEISQYLFGEGDQIHLRPPAGWAGDESRVIGIEIQIMEQPFAGEDLFLGFIA